MDDRDDDAVSGGQFEPLSASVGEQVLLQSANPACCGS
jgi:hypothetical protein